MKSVAIIIGSPRKGGSTHLLAKEAERGLQDQGFETDLVFLNELSIRGCQACYFCKKHDLAECVIADDMQRIHQLMQEADGIVVASPIYFGDVTAQTKLWLDRLFPFIGMDLSPKFQGSKPTSFIFTQNQPDPRLFSGQIGMFMQMVGLTGLSVRDHLVAYDLDAGYKPPVTENQEFMDAAYRIGQALLL